MYKLILFLFCLLTINSMSYAKDIRGAYVISQDDYAPIKQDDFSVTFKCNPGPDNNIYQIYQIKDGPYDAKRASGTSGISFYISGPFGGVYNTDNTICKPNYFTIVLNFSILNNKNAKEICTIDTGMKWNSGLLSKGFYYEDNSKTCNGGSKILSCNNGGWIVGDNNVQCP